MADNSNYLKLKSVCGMVKLCGILRICLVIWRILKERYLKSSIYQVRILLLVYNQQIFAKLQHENDENKMQFFLTCRGLLKYTIALVVTVCRKFKKKKLKEIYRQTSIICFFSFFLSFIKFSKETMFWFLLTKAASRKNHWTDFNNFNYLTCVMSWTNRCTFKVYLN